MQLRTQLAYSPFTEAGHGMRRPFMPMFAPPDDTSSAPEDSMDLGDDATNAFLSDLIGEEAAGEEKRKEKPEADQEAAEADEHEEEADREEGEADEDEEKADKEAGEADPDDAEVDLGENAKAKLRDLKEAFKAREEVTKAREEVAKERFQATTQTTLAKTALQKVLEKAEARWAPYAKLDFMALSRDPSIDNETFAALRQEAAAALEDVKFYREELGGVVQAEQARTQQASQAEAAATVQALSNPETGIKGWNQQMYNEILDHAETLGAPKAIARSLTAEWALRVLHKAMMFDRGATRAAAAVEKVARKPTRVLSPSKGDGRPTPGSAGKSAMAALRKSGDVDDAANAFFASFGVED